MPAPPDDARVRYVGAHAAALALERAANAGRPLGELVRDWFPDHDAVDRRAIARQVARELEHTRTLVLQRLDKLISKGKAVCPGGQVND